MNNLFGQPDGLVYLIQYNKESIYKIGYTTDLNTRSRRLQFLLPHNIEIIGRIHTDSPRWLEKHWHDYFCAKRRSGSGLRRRSEWFDLTPDDIKAFMLWDDKVWNKPVEVEPLPTVDLYFQPLREDAIKRVVIFYNDLIKKHPDCAVKLANSCNFQIRQLNDQVFRFEKLGRNEERTVADWELSAYRAATRKIEKSK